MASRDGRLAGKVAIVTGGGSGFGLAISKVYAREGCKILIGDLNTAGASVVSDQYGSSSVILQTMDVTKRSDWDAAVERALKEFGRLDILVNNAGTSHKHKPSLEVTEAELGLCFNVNVLSIFHSVAAVFPVLLKQGGGCAVINMSSSGAARPAGGLIWYNATKGAVSNITKGLALEYASHQIRVNGIQPRLSATGLFENFTGVADTPENRNKFMGGTPLGRLTDTMDVANAALFLASDEASFITGVNLDVDGGRSI